MADCTGVISQMYIYPVKSCAGIEVSEAILYKTGLSYDREWMIVDQDGQFVTQRQIPHMVWILPRLTADALYLSAPEHAEIRIPLSTAGTSKQVTVWRDTLIGNDIGIFFCWGVKYGLAEHNQIDGNRVGISIGHRDTDNLVTGNTIRGNKLNGVLFRPERGADFAGHRNRIEKNTFLDNAPEGGAVIDIQGGTESITIRDNQFTETRSGKPRVVVKQGADTKNIIIEGSRTKGL